jgi:hypothetical protein
LWAWAVPVCICANDGGNEYAAEIEGNLSIIKLLKIVGKIKLKSNNQSQLKMLSKINDLLINSKKKN